MLTDVEQKRLLRLGLKVKYYRMLIGMKTETLAEICDLSVNTIWQLESPSTPKPVSLKTLWNISDALGIHISKLLSDD